MTTQTAAIEKWLLVQIFIKIWLRIQVQKKNAESCRSRLRHFGPWPPLLSTSRVFHIKLLFFQRRSLKPPVCHSTRCHHWAQKQCESTGSAEIKISASRTATAAIEGNKCHGAHSKKGRCQSVTSCQKC